MITNIKTKSPFKLINFSDGDKNRMNVDICFLGKDRE